LTVEMNSMIHVSKEIALSLLLASCLLSACAGAPETESAFNEQIEDTAVENSIQATPIQDQFVIVPRTARLYFAPREDAHFLNFRSQEEQERLEERWRDDVQKWAERTQAAFAKEQERESKRMRKMKKREDREEYAETRRQSRANRLIRDIDRRAKRIGESPTSRWIVLKKVAESENFVEVETLLPDHEMAHCYQRGLGGIAGAKLRLWVKQEDLATVTRNVKSYPIWRGTEVKLTAGVVVEDGTAMVDGFRLKINFAPEDLGKSYVRAGLFEAPYTETVFSNVAYAEKHLQLSPDQTLPFNPFVEIYVKGTLRVDSRFYATAQTSCGEYTVLAHDTLLVPSGRRGAVRMDGGPVAEPPFARKGTELLTPDGTVIGMAAQEVSLGAETKTNGPDGTTCFEKLLWTPGRRQKVPDGWKVEWCVAEDAINR